MISKEKSKKIEKMLVSEMIRENTPGLSISVVKDNELIYSAAFGSSNLTKRTPVTTDTLFVLASVTKSFIGIGILKLYELKKLDLKDPITKFLPLDEYENSPLGKSITIHHLLTHTSGIPNISDGLNVQQLALEYDFEDPVPSVPFASWNDVFRLVNSYANLITDKPGTKFYYNNIGYTLLAKIIEVVSSNTLSEFMKKTVFEPLEMFETDFVSEKMLNNNKMTEFYIDNKSGKQIQIKSTDRNTGEFWLGPGGLISSTTDLANYLIMLFGKGIFKSKRIISEELLSLSFMQHFVEQFPYDEFFNFYGKYGQTGYGYGFVIQNDFFGHTLVHHSGSSIGASSWIALIPEQKIGVIIACNKHPSPRIFAHAVLMVMLDINPDENFPILKIRKIYDKLEGMYEIFNGLSKLEVKNKNNILTLYFEPSMEQIILTPYRDLELTDEQLPFFVQTSVGGKKPFVFEIDKNGTIWLNIERNKYKKI